MFARSLMLCAWNCRGYFRNWCVRGHFVNFLSISLFRLLFYGLLWTCYITSCCQIYPKSAPMHSCCVCKISERYIESAAVQTDLNEDMFTRKRVLFSRFERPWRVYFWVSQIGTSEAVLCGHLRAMCEQIFEEFGAFRLYHDRFWPKWPWTSMTYNSGVFECHN